MKGLNNDDVMQSALCAFIYASLPFHPGGAWALFIGEIKEAAEGQDFNINISASPRLVSQQVRLD